jgi:hypothetical protein
LPHRSAAGGGRTGLAIRPIPAADSYPGTGQLGYPLTDFYRHRPASVSHRNFHQLTYTDSNSAASLAYLNRCPHD